MLAQVTQTILPPSASVVQVIEAGQALPLLDLRPFLRGEPGADDQLVADVKLIQETLGFYAIINHGVDPQLIDDLVEQTRLLFTLPDEEKLKYRHDRHMQGYWPSDTVSANRPGFEKETEKASSMGGWVFGRDRKETDPKVVNGVPHRAPNRWPDPAKAPKFRPMMELYQSQMLALGQKLVPIYARILGLEPDYFEKDFRDPEWYTRCNYHSGGGSGMFVNAHSDHSFLSLLPISRVPGLQVRTPAETWIDATHIEGAMVVNTGEWLNRLSNGRLLATPHRVTQPIRERISIPFFMDPNDEANDDPVPGALKPGEARKFPPATFGEFYASYIDELTLPNKSGY
jgi:isopenicillin N synthase-like dioxygenase